MLLSVQRMTWPDARVGWYTSPCGTLAAVGMLAGMESTRRPKERSAAACVLRPRVWVFCVALCCVHVSIYVWCHHSLIRCAELGDQWDSASPTHGHDCKARA